ncbi:conserved hypothetical transmembrane protein [Archaeoglobus fulgidus DSM 4304]|uniref:Probable membrane transporter protein n=2 Tax=Archaeoglobus fulgidus TaxID=2234 RepID=O29897_ARCFU|nr:conserved hypothetical transmembrane protein [Archaeoglobus fulgidus DSM 4304]
MNGPDNRHAAFRYRADSRNARRSAWHWWLRYNAPCPRIPLQLPAAGSDRDDDNGCDFNRKLRSCRPHKAEERGLLNCKGCCGKRCGWGCSWEHNLLLHRKPAVASELHPRLCLPLRQHRMIYEGTIKRAMPEKPGNEVPGSSTAKATIGFVIGIITGIVGLGGGYALVPSFIYLLGSAVKIAVGTSLAEVLLPPFLPQTKVHMEGNQKGSL